MISDVDLLGCLDRPIPDGDRSVVRKGAGPGSEDWAESNPAPNSLRYLPALQQHTSTMYILHCKHSQTQPMGRPPSNPKVEEALNRVSYAQHHCTAPLGCQGARVLTAVVSILCTSGYLFLICWDVRMTANDLRLWLDRGWPPSRTAGQRFTVKCIGTKALSV
ncbi:hypothetical protein QR685DRAFT_337004 [Neurospora intermedia]|uniref:Uncharacterized protein n=1 Tax=Neurospora intermedia TaxID=5142 RepID=A0ABR3D7H3_NEUIN